MRIGFNKRGLIIGFEVDTHIYWDAEDDNGQYYRWRNVYRLCPLPFISIWWYGRTFSHYQTWQEMA